ncbi:MAG TPA: GvpL/GvpF family gas vesicle protein [Blastocatellia bacterium]|nr:GvpL/GvpF family gas vesicle protein [Blastocatellia bacterium]
MQPTSKNEAENAKCHVYCFCSAPAPEVSHISGIEDSGVRAIQHEGVIAIAGDCSRPPEMSIHNVVAHNRVVSSILEATTPIPCRFGTTLSRRDLEIYIESRGEAVKALLRKFQGCVEMTLRIASIADASTGAPDGITHSPPDLSSPALRGPGTRFLEQKMRESSQQRLASQHAQALLAWTDSQFGALVRDRVARPNPERSLVARVAHLLERARLQRYQELIAVAQCDRPDLRLSVSGPWAPYSFAVLGESIR